MIALAITMWAIPPIRASRLGQVLRTESLRRRTDGAQPRCRQFSRAGHAPQRWNCLAGHVGLEAANPSAGYLIGIP